MVFIATTHEYGLDKKLIREHRIYFKIRSNTNGRKHCTSITSIVRNCVENLRRPTFLKEAWHWKD